MSDNSSEERLKNLDEPTRKRLKIKYEVKKDIEERLENL